MCSRLDGTAFETVNTNSSSSIARYLLPKRGFPAKGHRRKLATEVGPCALSMMILRVQFEIGC